MGSLSQDIKDKAKLLGFSSVGITTVEPIAKAESWLQSLKNRGISIPFVSGDAATRTSPKLLWPKAKSLVIAGWPYEVSAIGPVATDSLKGYLTAGTYGQDYHDLLQEKLVLLKYLLEKKAGKNFTEIFVDTTPLLERAFAVRAGLGIWGQNTFIMKPGLAQTFFIGGLATSTPLEPDSPVTDTCLQCGRCQQACPTGALAVPYRLDYHRCLSYWTQTREMIPRELRPLLGNRIYGCDSCLRACPLIEKSPRQGVTVDLMKFLGLTKAEFRQQYGNSSIAWRGRTVLQRNAVLALGNSRNETAIPVLTQALQDHRVSIRVAAAWSLGQYKTEESDRSLQKQWEREQKTEVREEIEAALQRICT